MCLTYKKWSSFLIILLAFFVCLLPWIAHSLSHFDQFFITDNSRRVINIQATTPYCFFTPEYAAKTLFTHPMDWLSNMLSLSVLMIKELLRHILDFTFIILITVCLFICAVREKRSFFRRRSNWLIFALLLSGMTIVVLLIAVHYQWNCRYYAPYISLYIISALILMRSIKSRFLLSLSYIVLCVALYDTNRNLEFKSAMLRGFIHVHDDSFKENRQKMVMLTEHANNLIDYVKAEGGILAFVFEMPQICIFRVFWHNLE